MKTQEEMCSLVQAVRIVTDALSNAINSEDTFDRMSTAIFIMPLVQELDEFVNSIKAEMKEEEKPVEEDSIEHLINSFKPSGILS